MLRVFIAVLFLTGARFLSVLGEDVPFIRYGVQADFVGGIR